jgi:NADH:ubiquinone reductase (H+-translocating)
MPVNIPDPIYKRVVIVGGGFGGLTLARQLANTQYQVVLMDKNNYHQFQPLFYQVAMAGIEPSSIVFPFRKIFQKADNVLIRVAELQEIFSAENYIMTNQGRMKYDFLILAHGADTNYYGNQRVMENAIPMKSVSEALYLRNAILEDYEKAVETENPAEIESLMDIVIVGGGPTGVEVAGALAEMRENVIPKEYKELNIKNMDIYLIQSGDMLLKGMSDHAAIAAEKFLTKMGIIIQKNKRVLDYDGETVTMDDGTSIKAKKVIWAAGIVGNPTKGIPETAFGSGRRLKVDRQNRVEGHQNVFALGDIALMSGDPKFENGHPQVAQGAIQQGKQLGKNLLSMANNKPLTDFHFRDLGSMATIGRNKAVVDLPFWRFQGFFAWVVWLVVHLFSLIGIKNKIFVFINWLWSYITYDQALRLLIRPYIKPRKTKL